MKLVAFATLLGSITLSSVAADGATAGEGGKSWGYKNNDPSMFGPSEWGKQYPTCAGKRQSPIDITVKSKCDSDVVQASAPLEFTGACPDFKLKQTEDAYKGEVQNGACC